MSAVGKTPISIHIRSVGIRRISIGWVEVGYSYLRTGFPKKKKSVSDLLSAERKDKVKENVYFKYICNRASFMGDPVGRYNAGV